MRLFQTVNGQIVPNLNCYYMGVTVSTLAQLLTSARNRIVADCADKGIILTTLDVVIFGAPS